jgi:hypothetical protein
MATGYHEASRSEKMTFSTLKKNLLCMYERRKRASSASVLGHSVSFGQKNTDRPKALEERNPASMPACSAGLKARMYMGAFMPPFYRFS